MFIIVQNTRNINYHGGNGLYLDSWKLRNLREKLLDIKPIPLPFQFIPFPPPCLLWDLEHCLALPCLALSSKTCFNNFSTIPHLIELKVSKSLDIATPGSPLHNNASLSRLKKRQKLSKVVNLTNSTKNISYNIQKSK